MERLVVWRNLAIGLLRIIILVTSKRYEEVTLNTSVTDNKLYNNVNQPLPKPTYGSQWSVYYIASASKV